MYKHNRHHGYTSRNCICNTDLSIYSPQAGRLHYHDGDNGGGGRFALRNDDDVATDDALHSGHPIQHAPAELTRDSGSMLLGASLLQGSHCGSNLNGDNGSSRRFALCDDDDITTDDALCVGCPIQHAPAKLKKRLR
jgi:hypothetical protein